MKKKNVHACFDFNNSPCDSLAEFIEKRSTDVDFKVHDWLETLMTAELRRVEEHAQDCCYGRFAKTIFENEADGIIDVALMAYSAEMCYEVASDEAFDVIENLLVGLSVAACIERLKRNGWLVITKRMSILVQSPRPYQITQKGLMEGLWSNDPLTLWILGASLSLH